MIRTLLTSAILAAITLACVVGAVLLANYGASRLWFLVLLVVPLTVGLPTTCGILLCTALLQGPPLWLWTLSSGIAGFLLQVPAALALRAARKRAVE